MKMGDAALYPMFAATVVRNVGRKFGYVRGKGFKTENIVDYTSAEKMVFLEGRKLTLDRANEKHIALCLSR
jgi:hypothetical protein